MPSETNDFTYAVQVMYTPYLQKMGGRDLALRMARAAPAQMQAQHVRFVSWTPLRPYTYAAGRQRRYAVVRFEAVLDAAGRGQSSGVICSASGAPIPRGSSSTATV